VKWLLKVVAANEGGTAGGKVNIYCDPIVCRIY
jgi:hypothetical protein